MDSAWVQAFGAAAQAAAGAVGPAMENPRHPAPLLPYLTPTPPLFALHHPSPATCSPLVTLDFLRSAAASGYKNYNVGTEPAGRYHLPPQQQLNPLPYVYYSMVPPPPPPQLPVIQLQQLQQLVSLLPNNSHQVPPVLVYVQKYGFLRFFASVFYNQFNPRFHRNL